MVAAIGEAGGGGQGLFQTTRWSRVLRTCGEDSALAGHALAELCEACWHPLYAFVRRSGRGREEALDLTQEFFARLLEKHGRAGADPARGRFRSFLLAALKHFLANEWHRSQTRKRGGHLSFISRDALEAEGRDALETPDAATPELLYERRWAEALLARLAEEYRAHPLGWAALQRFIVETRAEVSLVETAHESGVTESALRSVVHKLRRRLQELVRAEVAAGPGWDWFAAATGQPEVAVWHEPAWPLPVPAWLPDLAEAVAGLRLEPNGIETSVPATELLRLKAHFATTNAPDAWTRWAKWFLADRGTRTIAWDSEVTVPAHVEALLAQDTLESLRQAVRFAPTNALALARLARATLADTNNPCRLPEADFLSRRAAELAPQSAEVKRLREEVAGRHSP